MAEADVERMRRPLRVENPWWAGGGPPEALAKPFRGGRFEALKNSLDRPDILALSGPRQVGKTTLMHQLVQYLLEDRKVSPRRVLFHSFDAPGTAYTNREALHGIIDFFVGPFQKAPLRHGGPSLFVFLDEVAKVEGWARTLKGWYDLRYPVKFVVSDSSQALLWRGAAEFLVGRVLLEPIHPMGLADTGCLRGMDWKLSGSACAWAADFAAAIQRRSVKGTYTVFGRIESEVGEIDDRLDIELERYLLVDGFPALATEESLAVANARFRQYFDLTVYKDLVRTFQIRNPKALEQLAVLVAAGSAQRTNYEKLSQTLKVKIDTLRDYLDYLESASLIATSEFYGRSRAVSLRRPKKLYLRNCGVRNALAGDLTEELLEDPARLGHVVETVVAEHALRLSQRLTGHASLAYWQDDTGREVDIIIGPPLRPLPIEVKYQQTVGGSDLTPIRAFVEKYRTGLGLVVTREHLEVRGNVVLVPLKLFLLAT